ncbi:MAG: YfhO family protein [Thermomicrobiales bacterium]
MQISRYVDYLVAINGVRLNYHDAAILSPGIESPLLALLNPQYVITPFEIAADRPELQYVQANMTQVYNNGLIRVFENPNALPHAWITHDVQTMAKDDILPALQDGSINPRQTAIVEQAAPVVQPATGTGESVTFTAYEPDEMSMNVTANSDGFLVLSEVYATGWNAYVDGKQVDIYATDYVLRGIPIGTGTHTVELRYELRSLTIGFWLSIVTGLAVLAFLILNIWQLRTKREIRWLNNVA